MASTTATIVFRDKRTPSIFVFSAKANTIAVGDLNAPAQGAPAIVGMSGQNHVDFLRVLADKQMRSNYESMGKEDKIGNEAFRWARAKVFNSNRTSVGRAIAFGCATRCHLSVHSLAMPESG